MKNVFEIYYADKRWRKEFKIKNPTIELIMGNNKDKINFNNFVNNILTI